MLKFNLSLPVSIACIIMLGITPASAETILHCAPEYPGIGMEGRGITNYAASILARAALGFYKVHGRWPATAQEMREDGLLQIDLVGFNLDLIDPDDKQMNCPGDAYYVLNPQTHRPIVRYMDATGRMGSQLDSAGEPRTYAALLAGGKAKLPDSDTSDFDNNSYLLRTCAIMGMIKQGMVVFQLTHGRLPNGWAELADSQLCGLDRSSINPMTGKPITGVAGPNEIEFRIATANGTEILAPDGVHATPGDQAVVLRIFDSEGKPYPVSFAP
jgi:hypothetical protein